MFLHSCTCTHSSGGHVSGLSVPCRDVTEAHCYVKCLMDLIPMMQVKTANCKCFYLFLPMIGVCSHSCMLDCATFSDRENKTTLRIKQNAFLISIMPDQHQQQQKIRCARKRWKKGRRRKEKVRRQENRRKVVIPPRPTTGIKPKVTDLEQH